MRRDSGFSMAALVIFLTAASILLTISVPSYVMEAKREQEKELVFRGEEYTRAIQKYQRTLNLLPTSVDDLLSSNGTRFLRKAYADPVSGEPWRVIILNADGTLTGSNIYPTMANVPTTTSVRNTAQPATAPKASGGTVGSLGTTNPFSAGPGAGVGAAGGNGLGTGGAGIGAGGTGLGTGGTGVGGGTAANSGNRPPGGGSVPPSGGQGTAPPQQQATPLTGIVGVGSASKGPSVMVYNTQEQYSNWEFIAQLQQRTTPGAGGAGSGAAGGGSGRPPTGATGGTGGVGGTGGFGASGGAGAGAGAGGAGRTR